MLIFFSLFISGVVVEYVSACDEHRARTIDDGYRTVRCGCVQVFVSTCNGMQDPIHHCTTSEQDQWVQLY
jgi:hypothetical protein